MIKITWNCGISKVRFERVGDRSFFLIILLIKNII